MKLFWNLHVHSNLAVSMCSRRLVLPFSTTWFPFFFVCLFVLFKIQRSRFYVWLCCLLSEPNM
jgi:hypothetical protein